MPMISTPIPAENTPTLQTRRLILRRFTEADAEAALPLLQDQEVNAFLPWFPVKNLDEAREHLRERYFEKYEQPSGYHYAICMRADNQPIGYINVSDGDSHDLGYGLRKEFWHRGIVTEACRAVTERLRTAGFPYLTATHDLNNPRSGGVMRNLGMTYRYTYEERWQPKNRLVRFRLYQLDFADPPAGTYLKYWEMNPVHYVEDEASL